MASASPNPYKSRIFNAVSQQYRQFLDRCDRLGRQIRLTASQTTQVLLYPLYVVLQGARVISKQLNAQSNIGLPQLNNFVKTQGSRPNESIEKLLKTVAPTAPGIQLQGIANRLDTQELVLVAAPTQTLIPLTQSQQHTIQQRITNPLKPTFRKTPQLQSTVPAMGLILPVYCILSQAMGWVQASPIAVRMNLFGESALAQVEPLAEDKLAVFADPQSSREQTAPPTTDSPRSSIKGLIRAAIHYFFNQSTLELNGVEPQSQSILPADKNASLLNSDQKPFSRLPQTEDQTPQLTSGIWQKMQHSSFPLFAGMGVGGFLVVATLGKYILKDEPQQTQVQSSSPQPLADLTPETETQWIPGNGLTNNEEYDNKYVMIQSRQSTTVGLQPAYSENTTDYLETPVSSVEYVKHPLVNFLEWLDRAIFWVEESFLKLRNWITAQIK